jgi:hypothetical protein
LIFGINKVVNSGFFCFAPQVNIQDSPQMWYNKANMKFKVITTISGLLLIFLCLLFGMNSSVNAGQQDKVYGWAWSENIGWLSMNCYNTGGGACPNDFGVDFDSSTGKVFGEAWSEFGGWVCFGSTCSVWSPALTPASTSPEIDIFTSGLLSGWAKWHVLGADGWIKMLGPQSPPTSPVPGLFEWCQNCDASGNCLICFESELYRGSSRICENCTGCAPDGPDDHNCNSCTRCYAYGVAIDYGSNRLMGWGWNGDLANHGFGWLQFHHSQAPPTLANPPYLSTLLGDIYAKMGLGSLYSATPPDSRFSGTFMLQSDGQEIVHFNSCMRETGGVVPGTSCFGRGGSSDQGWVTKNMPLDFPDESTSYRNQFGEFDLKGLFAGQYGPREDIISALDIDNPLDGRVYYRDGDLTISNPMVFNNGLGGVSGAGTIIVRGNLYINENITYDPSNVANLHNLASLGVIVLDDGSGTKGRIIIDSTVTELVGNFYAENYIETQTGDQQIYIYGLMITREFAFNRQYADIDTLRPAETVIYDGRVMANTPPGFFNIMEYLPTWITGG